VRSNRRFVIGIDGGGTKTTAAICTEQGMILGRASAGSSNILSRPWEEVEQTLRQVIGEVIAQAGAHRDEVELVLFGLAGADRAPVQERILTALEYEFLDRIAVENDAINALYSGTWGEPGVVLIAGTGSIAYGLSANGKRFRVGGWGYLVGDEGSGYEMGARAVRAVLREFDGRGTRTMLTEQLMTHFALNRVDELIHRLYSAANPRKELAELSVLVERAAARGDEVALAIVQQAADALIELAVTCLEKTRESVPVVLAGGLLAADTLLRRRVIAADAFRSVIPHVPPVVGSLVLALQQAGIRVTATHQQSLAQSWQRRGETDGGTFA